MLKQVELYTDGACSGNPGNGGWAAILIYKGREKAVSGFMKDTTNNRMELFSVIQGLRTLKEPCRVTVYSDSQYLVEAFNNGWINEWQNNGWRRADNGEVKNVDLWKTLLSLMKTHSVEYVKVKGHADNEYNNRCDKMAVAEIKKLQG
jgi:ribonuclease HI